MRETWFMRTLSLFAVVCLLVAPAARSSGQTADGRSNYKVTQTVQVYDALVVYPPPLWVQTEDDAVNGSEVYRNQDGDAFVLEQIRKSQTFANWTEMLKVTGLQSPEVRKIGVPEGIAVANGAYVEACGHDNVGQHVFDQDTTSALFAVFCGNTANGPRAVGYGDGVGEISVNRLFIVKNTLVVVQYAWRSGKFDPADQATFPVPTPTIMRAVELLQGARVAAN